MTHAKYFFLLFSIFFSLSSVNAQNETLESQIKELSARLLVLESQLQVTNAKLQQQTLKIQKLETENQHLSMLQKKVLANAKIKEVLLEKQNMVIAVLVLAQEKSEKNSRTNTVSSNKVNPVERYKNLVNKAIEHIELQKYAEGLIFLDEAKRKTPSNSSGALATTLKKVNANLWKNDQLKRAQLEDLEQDLKKVQQLLKDFKWEEPKVFAKAKLEWTEKQIIYSEMIGDAKIAYAESQFNKAIRLLKKVPKDSILFDSELKNTLNQWQNEHETRLIQKARQLVNKMQFRQAIPILDEAQGVKRKYNTEIVNLRETCEMNLSSATLFEEAKAFYSKGRNQEALSKLAKVKRDSAIYKEAKKLRKEIYTTAVLNEVLDLYLSGNGDESLILLAEVEGEKFVKLKKKISKVVSYYAQIKEEESSASPNQEKIKKAAMALIALEKNHENWYHQEAFRILKDK